jgi:hypothetical protein
MLVREGAPTNKISRFVSFIRLLGGASRGIVSRGEAVEGLARVAP